MRHVATVSNHIQNKELSVEVEHVTVHRTKKDKKDMSHFEKFATEGNEKADELAKVGATLDEGFMAEARTVQQERRSVRSLAVCSQRSLFGGRMERIVKSSSRSQKKGDLWTREEKKVKHQTEWCAQANRYRCMRCGRSSGY